VSFKYFSYCISRYYKENLCKGNMKNLEKPEVHLRDHWNFNVKYFKFIVIHPSFDFLLGVMRSFWENDDAARSCRENCKYISRLWRAIRKCRLLAASAGHGTKTAGCRARVTTSISLSAPSDDWLTIATEIYARR